MQNTKSRIIGPKHASMLGLPGAEFGVWWCTSPAKKEVRVYPFSAVPIDVIGLLIQAENSGFQVARQEDPLTGTTVPVAVLLNKDSLMCS